MFSLLDYLKMGAAAIAAGAVVYATMALYDSWIDDPAVYAEGQAAERLLWEKAMADARVEAAIRLKAAQDKIDAAERKYFEDRAGDALKIADLEAALKEEKDNAQDTGDRPPAFSRRVVRSLNAIGR